MCGFSSDYEDPAWCKQNDEAWKRVDKINSYRAKVGKRGLCEWGSLKIGVINSNIESVCVLLYNGMILNIDQIYQYQKNKLIHLDKIETYSGLIFEGNSIITNIAISKECMNKNIGKFIKETHKTFLINKNQNNTSKLSKTEKLYCISNNIINIRSSQLYIDIFYKIRTRGLKYINSNNYFFINNETIKWRCDFQNVQPIICLIKILRIVSVNIDTAETLKLQKIIIPQYLKDLYQLHDYVYSQTNRILDGDYNKKGDIRKSSKR